MSCRHGAEGCCNIFCSPAWLLAWSAPRSCSPRKSSRSLVVERRAAAELAAQRFGCAEGADQRGECGQHALAPCGCLARRCLALRSGFARFARGFPASLAGGLLALLGHLQPPLVSISLSPKPYGRQRCAT